MRISMEFDVKNNTPGKVPKFGAIFMSNSATRKECYRRKLLGFPLGQADFVKQIKAGMILFLFEFENRELHGVFQACSDGAINIVPHAFKSSGKQFPSQVKFTPIWHCSPLSESEFCDAIKENYFSANKFNFGLSEKQVQKLLSLFSLRKIKDKHLQRHFTRSEVERPIGFPLYKDRNAIDGGSFLMINDEKDEQHTDANFESVMFTQCSTDYIKQFEDNLGEVGRAVDDGWYATSNTVGNEHDVDIDPRLAVITDYPGHSFTATRSIPDPISVEMIRPKSKWNEHNGPCVSTEYPGLFQSISPVYSGKSNLEANSLINDQLQQSTMHSSMQSQNLNVSYSAISGDAVGTSITPYDLDVPALNYSHSSMPEFSLDDSIFPHLENQSLSSHVEPKCTSRYANINSGLFDNVFSSGPNLYEYSNKISKLFPGAAYPENTYEDAMGFSIPNRTNKGASFSYSPSKSPSCAFDSRYPVASLDKHDHKLLCFENDEALVTDVPVLKKGNSRSVVCHENTSKNLDISDSEKMYYVRPKKRESVFSRLSLPPKASEQGNDTQIQHDESSMDSSVDEVMAMLHGSRYKWVKERSFKKPISRHDDVTNKANKRPVTMISKHSTNKISKEIGRNVVSASGENVVQVAENIPFVDFKRRSKVRKGQDDASSGGCNESVESNGSSGGQHKRRKLIRPKFSMNESSGDVMIGSQDKKVLLHAGIQNIVDNEQSLCIGCEDKNIDAKKDSNYEKEKTVESCVVSFGNSDEERKEESLSVGIHNVPFSGFCKVESCDVEESSTFKNFEDDGSSQNYNDTSCSIFQESILELHEETSVTVTYGGLDIDGGSIKSFQNFEFEDKFCQIGGGSGSTWRNSMKHNFELEKLTRELGNGNLSTQQLSVESVTGLCKASTEAVRFGNMQESSQGICEENDEKGERLDATPGKNCKVKFEDNIEN